MISLERRDGRPLVIGHKGAASLAPENTLAGFRAAVAAGVDLVEFDVLALAGGELVIGHSHDLYELSHGAETGTAASMSLGDLQALCPQLPTLDEALTFFKDEAPRVGVHLDLKSPAALAEVARTLAQHGLVERSLVSSFHLGALRDLARLEPGIRVGASFPRDRLGIDRRRGFGHAVTGGLRVLRPLTPVLVGALLARAQATVLVLHHALVSASAVQRAHARGAAVVAWTVDDRNDFDRVEEAGVDAVVTNNPSIFVSTLTT